jgi:hypothetical protein
MIAGLRTLAVAGLSSLGLVVYLVLWFRWPVAISLGVGVLMALLVVLTSASLGADPAEADAAWRAAAPDLVDRPAGTPGQPPGRDGHRGLGEETGTSSVGGGPGGPSRSEPSAAGSAVPGGSGPEGPAGGSPPVGPADLTAVTGPGVPGGVGAGISSGGGSRR